MSNPQQQASRLPASNPPAFRARPPRSALTRRPSVTGVALTNPVTGGAKAQRTSKTTQKLVVLPSAPQTKPIPLEADEDAEQLLGYETDQGVREHKSAGERMSKQEREKAGFGRITAYCIAEGFKMKLLASFLKREHNVKPRVYDEAMYVMYHLPLLPGYGPGSNIRSSAPAVTPGNEDPSSGLSEAEEDGYQGTYFNSEEHQESAAQMEGYMPSASPVIATHGMAIGSPEQLQSAALEQARASGQIPIVVTTEEREHEPSRSENLRPRRISKRKTKSEAENFAEAIFFDYGVVVFYGFREDQELGILEDVEEAGVMLRKIPHDDWEVEAFHYAHDPNIAFPRIFNDFFTFKTHSHLLQLSVAHALAQSTLLAHYETLAHRILSAPSTRSIPTQLALTGVLALPRKDALKLTGRLFTLRRDVNLVSNVLDVPELFWDEASLKALYDAVREYMEIGPRVQVMNEKIAVAEDLLSAIHDHLNTNAMDRITWIIIWLIVVACLVEAGEVIARLIVHATMGSGSTPSPEQILASMSRDEALAALDRIARGL
ncbi:Sporulation protein RMD8 [Trametes pubescens]|uniref:Sporulation protein RMD8 n=1 Tax=Trametes pubescens TaxID=154538 RepID=A0A1M2W2E4_TRAPU|nr:Sporulation protein RMD8 [Trametes pubescens]